MANSIPISSIENAIDLYADPVHFPIAIGSDQFVITQQDHRHILDRRVWYLTRINPAPLASQSFIVADQPQQLALPQPQSDAPLQQLVQQILAALSQLKPDPTSLNPFQFHYEKQTSTDDLVYFLRRNGFSSPPVEPTEKVVRHVHFLVDRTSSNKATLTEDDVRMVCDTEEVINEESAYEQMKRRKERDGESW